MTWIVFEKANRTREEYYEKTQEEPSDKYSNLL